MKSLFFSLFFLFFFSISNAQVEDIFNNITGPSAFAVLGDDLYISRYATGEVMKMDLTKDPLLEDAVTGLDAAYGLAVRDSVLFIADAIGRAIYKLDLKETNPQARKILNLSNAQPVAMLIYGDFLYYTQYEGGGQVRKIDVSTSPVQSSKLVIGGLDEPTGLALYGNDLYITQTGNLSIDKIDITDANPVLERVLSGENEPFHLIVHKDFLYFSEYAGGKISKLDLSKEGSTPERIANLLQGPTGFAIYDNYLYFGQYASNTISRISLGGTVATNDLDHSNPLSVYPNPASEYLIVDQLEKKEALKVTDLSGRLIKEVMVDATGRIDIEALVPGVYFILLEKGPPLKFIKQ